MKALTTALFGKATGSSFLTAVGSRFYKHRAPENAVFPYAVYGLVSDTSDPTFAEQLEDVLIQFDLYSSASSSGEVEDLYTYLKSLYDDCTFAITGETLLSCVRENAVLFVEDYTTTAGTVEVWHYAVDYRIRTKVG